MGDIFKVILPKPIEAGDKIRICGQIANDATEFSINFANETDACPDNITYHFKWNLLNHQITENYKYNGEWMEENNIDYNSLDGRLTKHLTFNDSLSNGFNVNTNTSTDAFINSILGTIFALEFAFQDNTIYVYLVDGEGRNFITQYNTDYEFGLCDIQSLQVWGDVEKVRELTFTYD
ncbi:uncharacterized protein LOC119675051 isoform X1 [Teleopsis dalmanni]|uniref:uncharacterized protein LOC119675051 isoform X1 n=1 Tax=Teleopsis dalmanni TaxID=139649 RepID=UPI0018CF74BB|nr:uncharacterized protein LOC119675051 isoform X1 [Teleopsis dalmanni]